MPSGSTAKPRAVLTAASPFDRGEFAQAAHAPPQHSPYGAGYPPHHHGDHPPGAWAGAQMHAGPPPHLAVPPHGHHPHHAWGPPPGHAMPGGHLQAPPVGHVAVHSNRTQYFVITSNTKENVVKSLKHSVWATQKKNEMKLDDAYRHGCAQGYNVILIFSVNGSHGFQGYARMRSLVGRPCDPRNDPFNRFGKLFDVEWLKLHDLSFREVSHLRNSLNMDQGVSSSRDGQELSNMCGRAVCDLIDRHVDAHNTTQQSAAPAQIAPSGQPPAQATGQKPPRASSSESGSEKLRRQRKRRKRAPHPISATFDEQVEYFLDLDYDAYVTWWKRHATANPGPTPPPTMPHSVPQHGAYPPHHGGHPGMHHPQMMPSHYPGAPFR